MRLPALFEMLHGSVRMHVMLSGCPYLDCLNYYLGFWIIIWLEEDRYAELLQVCQVAGTQQLSPQGGGQPTDSTHFPVPAPQYD